MQTMLTQSDEISMSMLSSVSKSTQLILIGLIFAVSGMAALTYQIVWQRQLFLAFGTDMTSVTLIVSIFMFGLGMGGILGGQLADMYRTRCIKLFCMFEVAIGIFGLCSPVLLGWLGAADSPWIVATKTSVLLMFPTILMGSTLPLLSVAMINLGQDVGESVGTLYYFNTIGAAVACLLLGFWFFNIFGLHHAIIMAAVLNFTSAVSGYFLSQSQ